MLQTKFFRQSAYGDKLLQKLAPIAELYGPVIPASDIKQVPFGNVCASLVCTCVWVPQTASTKPSKYKPKTYFSLVVSAWKSMKWKSVFCWYCLIESIASKKPISNFLCSVA